MEVLTRWSDELLTTPVTRLIAAADPGDGRLTLLDEEDRDRAPSLGPSPLPAIPVPPNISSAPDTSASSWIASE